jgi:hypothetical protein
MSKEGGGSQPCLWCQKLLPTSACRRAAETQTLQRCATFSVAGMFHMRGLTCQ